jgi:hypothetical protein
MGWRSGVWKRAGPGSACSRHACEKEYGQRCHYQYLGSLIHEATLNACANPDSTGPATAPQGSVTVLSPLFLYITCSGSHEIMARLGSPEGCICSVLLATSFGYSWYFPGEPVFPQSPGPSGTACTLTRDAWRACFGTSVPWDLTSRVPLAPRGFSPTAAWDMPGRKVPEGQSSMVRPGTPCPVRGMGKPAAGRSSFFRMGFSQRC